MPLISVILSAYNAEDTILDSVESILQQTEKNFELILINDGSTDNTQSLIESIHDPRIQIINNSNLGLTKSLNIGIREASGVYVARQDADDISLPKRFEMQLEAFNSNPKLSLLGTRGLIHEDLTITESPIYQGEISKELLFSNVLIHSSVMFKRLYFQEIGLYDDSFKVSQDYDAWLRMTDIPNTEIKILNNILIHRHINQDVISKKNVFAQAKNSFRARYGRLNFFLNFFLSFRQYLLNILSPRTLNFLKSITRKNA